VATDSSEEKKEMNGKIENSIPAQTPV